MEHCTRLQPVEVYGPGLRWELGQGCDCIKLNYLCSALETNLAELAQASGSQTIQHQVLLSRITGSEEITGNAAMVTPEPATFLRKQRQVGLFPSQFPIAK